MPSAEMAGEMPDAMTHASMTQGGNWNAVSIEAYGCIFEGFSIKNASEGAGIYITSSNNTIRNNIINHCNEGIYLEMSSYNAIISNNISNSKEYGIYLFASIGNAIADNKMSFCRNGLDMVESIRNTLRSNIMLGNLKNFGAQIREDYDFGDNDIDTSNIVDGKLIYYLVGSSDSIIDSTSNAGTVYCINCQNITIEDFEVN
jgi:parallel beta-helix repeat protein